MTAPYCLYCHWVGLFDFCLFVVCGMLRCELNTEIMWVGGGCPRCDLRYFFTIHPITHSPTFHGWKQLAIVCSIFWRVTSPHPLPEIIFFRPSKHFKISPFSNTVSKELMLPFYCQSHLYKPLYNLKYIIL